jgi:hypothetical protein
VNYVIDFVGAHLLCRFILEKWSMIGIFLSIIAINYFVYYRTGKYRKIVEAKPRFFNSHRASIVITVMFIGITTSFLFWMADYLMFIIDRCR